MDLIFKQLEDKTIVWFSNNNQYVVLENITASILKKINENVYAKDIEKYVSLQLNVPIEQSSEFILDLKQQFFNNKESKELKKLEDYSAVKVPKNLKYIKFYEINNVVFKVEFSNEFEVLLIHPKFAHLEINQKKYQHCFVVFSKNKKLFLSVNNTIIKHWSENDIHYFQGKFSMEVIQIIHKKTEDNWMGVFHASAIGNSDKAVLFLGDSGNGKSTSLAILQANGFICMADDFVPMDATNQEVYNFPSAISIKKNSVDTLLPMYPELASTSEFHFKRLNKVVRYLKPNNLNNIQNLPCNELVFIKYKKGQSLEFREINKIDAFSKLVPDSWLSPKKQNVNVFLDWFSNVNCYQLTYSDNVEMTQTVAKLFNNEL